MPPPPAAEPLSVSQGQWPPASTTGYATAQQPQGPGLWPGLTMEASRMIPPGPVESRYGSSPALRSNLVSAWKSITQHAMSICRNTVTLQNYVLLS